MIIQIETTLGLVEGLRSIIGLSENGELYVLINNKWSHICSSPDDREKPYLDGKWKKRNPNV